MTSPALETGPPSGRVSLEQVVNVPARLQAPPLPQAAATQLKVSSPPLADTARYGGVRADAAAPTAQEADHA